MKVKIPKVLVNIITLSLITATLMYDIRSVNFSDTSYQTTYSTMSTMQLQIEVERLSQNGDLPFSMGMELIRRWTKDSGAIVN